MGSCHTKCHSTARLDDKTVVITGCNQGIGKITARDMYQRGAKVIMACRNAAKAESAVKDIQQECMGMTNLGELITIELDVASMSSVKDCAMKLMQSEQHIDILINNAGMMIKQRSLTKDGFEMQLATNYLGHFLFTLLLLPRLIKSTHARIVCVSTRAHTIGNINFDDINWEKREYSSTYAYAESKLATILFTKELDRRLKENGIMNVNTYSLHPGVIKTELLDNLLSSSLSLPKCITSCVTYFSKTLEQGAQTTIYCAVSEDAAMESGFYYSDCSKSSPSRAARNMNTAKRLWDVSLELVGLENDYNPFVEKLTNATKM